jgi:hypothetical protein
LALADEALAKGLYRIPELYYCMWTKDFGEDICEYFPIYLKEVDESKFAPDEWIMLARKGEHLTGLQAAMAVPVPHGSR